MMLPPVLDVAKLEPNIPRLFIGAYGFEDRSLGWISSQENVPGILTSAIMFRYKPSKGKNRVQGFRNSLRHLGIARPYEIYYNTRFPYNVGDRLKDVLSGHLSGIEEVILDISAMTKLLILISTLELRSFGGKLRIVYSEAEQYAPTKEDYEKSKEDARLIATFPSRGFDSIMRTRNLSGIRMQGQPVSLIAFMSFNEQLIRNMLGTMNPHRLLFVNRRQPRPEFSWRERAIQEIHSKLIEEYSADNPRDASGLLIRVASTVDYRDTVSLIDEIYGQLGMHERIICAATGSKMQTVGLFFSKIKHPDIHIEYPTPDSYFVRGFSRGVRQVHQVEVPNFSKVLESFAKG